MKLWGLNKLKRAGKIILDKLFGNYIVQSDHCLRRFLRHSSEIGRKVNDMSDEEYVPLLLSLYSDYRLTEAYDAGLIRKKSLDERNFSHQLLKYKLRLVMMLELLRERIPDWEKKQASIVDVGGNSGFFIHGLTGNGTCVNIDRDNVEYMNSHGINAVYGDIMKLELPDNSFDYALSFECVEHVRDPILALSELGRVARKSVFVSIPYVDKTRIADPELHNERKRINLHVYEFNLADFKKVAAHVGLKVTWHADLRIFKPKYPIYWRKYYHELALPSWHLIEMKSIEK